MCDLLYENHTWPMLTANSIWKSLPSDAQKAAIRLSLQELKIAVFSSDSVIYLYKIFLWAFSILEQRFQIEC